MNDDWLSFDLREGVGEDVPPPREEPVPRWTSREGWWEGRFRAT